MLPSPASIPADKLAAIMQLHLQSASKMKTRLKLLLTFPPGLGRVKCPPTHPHLDTLVLDTLVVSTDNLEVRGSSLRRMQLRQMCFHHLMSLISPSPLVTRLPVHGEGNGWDRKPGRQFTHSLFENVTNRGA
jgi:hypothetical protein